jgi:hypothetical protein
LIRACVHDLNLLEIIGVKAFDLEGIFYRNPDMVLNHPFGPLLAVGTVKAGQLRNGRRAGKNSSSIYFTEVWPEVNRFRLENSNRLYVKIPAKVLFSRKRPPQAS